MLRYCENVFKIYDGNGDWHATLAYGNREVTIQDLKDKIAQYHGSFGIMEYWDYSKSPDHPQRVETYRI